MTSPGVWILLAGIILLLVGTCVWGVFGHLDSTVDAAVISEGGKSVCLVPEEALASVLEEPVVRIDGEEKALAPAGLRPEIITKDTNIYVILAGKLQVVYRIPLEENLEEGICSGSLVTERLTSISMLMN